MNSQQCFELLSATAEVCHQQVRASQASAEFRLDELEAENNHYKNTGIVVIRSTPNSLIPLPVEKKVFKWDLDKFDYSTDALRHIELLMMMQQAFSVKTNESYSYMEKRINIVFGIHESVKDEAERKRQDETA